MGIFTYTLHVSSSQTTLGAFLAECDEVGTASWSHEHVVVVGDPKLEGGQQRGDVCVGWVSPEGGGGLA